jgi:hypothetical protein
MTRKPVSETALRSGAGVNAADARLVIDCAAANLAQAARRLEGRLGPREDLIRLIAAPAAASATGPCRWWRATPGGSCGRPIDATGAAAAAGA